MLSPNVVLLLPSLRIGRNFFLKLEKVALDEFYNAAILTVAMEKLYEFKNAE